MSPKIWGWTGAVRRFTRGGRDAGVVTPARLQILKDILAHREDRGGQVGRVGDFCSHVPIGSEQTVVLKDRRLDPALVDWLAKVNRRFAGMPRTAQTAIAVARYTTATFPRRLTPDRRAPTDPLLVLLGERIASKTGACRHIGLALQLALQELGIPSEFRNGRFREEFATDGEVVTDARHLWVEARVEGKLLLLDSTRRWHQELPTGIAANAPRLLEGRLLIDRTKAAYTLDAGSIANQTQALTLRDLTGLTELFERLDSGSPRT